MSTQTIFTSSLNQSSGLRFSSDEQITYILPPPQKITYNPLRTATRPGAPPVLPKARTLSTFSEILPLEGFSLCLNAFLWLNLLIW